MAPKPPKRSARPWSTVVFSICAGSVLCSCPSGCNVPLAPSPVPETAPDPVTTPPDEDVALPGGVQEELAPTIVAKSLPCCNPLERVFSIDTGDSVSLSQLRCRWDFGDGRKSESCRTQHIFPYSGAYRMSVSVTMPNGSSLVVNQVITVGHYDEGGFTDSNPGPALPGLPTAGIEADAGADRQVAAGMRVELVGQVSGTSSASNVRILWQQLRGTAVQIADATKLTAYFEAPTVLEDAGLVFRLTVFGDGFSVSDDVSIHVLPVRLEDLIAQHGYARADWWGYHADDATASLRAAIDSGADKVVVPDLGQPWIISPISLRDDLELYLEPGVTLEAKRGAFRDPQDTMLLLDAASNVTIVGNGATLRMHKDDYMSDDYARSEWRHGISLRGARNVLIEGLRIERTGGDGIYIGPGLTKERRPSEDIVIRDCVSSENYRQGMSVVSARRVRVLRCLFEKTLGTPPQAGVDVEPSFASDEIVDVEFLDCIARGNAGTGFMTNLSKLAADSVPVSIRFVNCTVQESAQPALRALLRENLGARGSVSFINSTVEDNYFSAVTLDWDTASPIALTFDGGFWVNVARRSDQPLLFLRLRQTEPAGNVGGVRFVNVELHNDKPARLLDVDAGVEGLFRSITGTVFLHGLPPDPESIIALDSVPELHVVHSAGAQ